MKFLDANIFIYAFYKPHVELDKEQKQLKAKSKEIVRGINEGEIEVLTTVAHLSEVSNILKRSLSVQELKTLFVTLYALENVKIVGVSAEDYLMALDLAEELKFDPNDSLAVHVMQENKITEIFSFDRGYEKVEGIKRAP